MESLKSEIRKSLKSDAENESTRNFQEAIIVELIKTAMIELPPLLIQRESEHMVSEQERMVQQANMVLDDYLQSQDRIHRISQKRSCQIYNLYIENSIDEYIDKLVRAKHISSQLASGDISKSEFIEEGRFDLAKTLQEILS